MVVNVVIKTADRKPRQNYLSHTLRNLDRAGVFRSPHLGSFTIVTTNPWRAPVEPGTPLPIRTMLDVPREMRTLHQNASRCIQVASEGAARYSMVLEDDLDFVNDFLENVVAWVEHQDGFPMYVLGANYAQIQASVARGRDYWLYPVSAFYGAQALIWRRELAEELAGWLGPDPNYNGITDHGHDLLLQQWGKSHGADYFLASAPSMVQHIGNESGIGNRFFRFESFPGYDWRYRHGDKSDYRDGHAANAARGQM